MENIQKYLFSLFLVCLFASTSCNKFLDAKPDASLSIPETFEDIRALMNNEGQINRSFPALSELGSDDFYIKSNVLNARPEAERLVYTWTSDAQRYDLQSWTAPYKTIMTANIVLESLERITAGSTSERDILRGQALFVRAFAFYYLAQIFCLPYDVSNRNIAMGLPLRSTSDYAVEFGRSTLGETYDFIIKDLLTALDYLPEKVEFKSRSSKAAALALLARLYLIMGDYTQAGELAKATLDYNDKLQDYNSIDPTLKLPFSTTNIEFIYYAFCNSGYLLANSRAFIPKDFYESYADDDLRKTLYFNRSSNGDILFKGSYDGVGSNYFAGIATDEIYLIRAECEIRKGNLDAGLEVLNRLLKYRYKTGSFIPYKDLSDERALDLVISERRKELVKRGIRWTDLRRLVKDGKGKTVYRKADDGVNNEKYALSVKPESYVYPIPPDIMRLGNYNQNPL